MKVQRMLGIVEDKDDIAFDNASWYLSSDTDGELARDLWVEALKSGDSAQCRLLDIFRHVVDQANETAVLVGEDEASLPLPIHATFTHLGDIVNILRRPPLENLTLVTTFGTVEQRLGSLRMRAVDLLANLLETRNTAICDAVAALDALPLILDFFFLYKWNSALHSTVLRMVNTIFDTEAAGTAMTKLQERLLADSVDGGCNLLSRIMDEYHAHTPEEVEVLPLDAVPGDNQEPLDMDAAKVEKKCVVASTAIGYMSCMLDMGARFKGAFSFSQSLRALTQQVCGVGVSSRWEEFDKEVLQRMEKMCPSEHPSRCLGGEKPRPSPTCGQM